MQFADFAGNIAARLNKKRFQFLKHNSLADFTDKVTSKELFNIYKKNLLCYNVWKGYCILFCITHAKFKKSAKIIMYYMRISDTFLQLAKATLLSL